MPNNLLGITDRRPSSHGSLWASLEPFSLEQSSGELTYSMLTYGQKAEMESMHSSTQGTLRVFHGSQPSKLPPLTTLPVMLIYPDAWKLFISMCLIAPCALVPCSGSPLAMPLHLQAVQALVPSIEKQFPSFKTSQASPCSYTPRHLTLQTGSFHISV